MPNAAALTLEDKISDPIMPELDPSLLDFRPMEIDFNSKKDDPLNWNSQLLSDPGSVEIGRHAPPRDPRNDFDEEDMNIDLDLDLGLGDGPTMDWSQKAPPLNFEDDLLDNGRLPEDFTFQDRTRLSSRVPSLIDDDGRREPDEGQMMLDDDDYQLPSNDANEGFNLPREKREAQVPLPSPRGSARSSEAGDFEPSRLNEDEDMSIHQATHRAKKRKVLQEDSETMLSSHQIKQQQADRSAILKPTSSFLSRDTFLLNLINMQKNGDFVSSIMGDGGAKGWAPELQGLLSFDSVKKASELKRKRDSGVADVSENEAHGGQETALQFDIPDETFDALDGGDVGYDTTNRDKSEVHLPAEDGIMPQGDEEDLDADRDQFDETTAPLLHPSEHGAISQGTKHAVHLLRDRFGSAADGSPSKQRKNHIMFQELLPEKRTSKADATKMFFEVLVLATKDAVKVEQSNQEVGSALRIRAKRGLWGSWAETEAGGEIAEQEIDVQAGAAS